MRPITIQEVPHLESIVNSGLTTIHVGCQALAEFAGIGLKIPRGSSLRVGSSPTSGTK